MERLQYNNALKAFISHEWCGDPERLEIRKVVSNDGGINLEVYYDYRTKDGDFRYNSIEVTVWDIISYIFNIQQNRDNE
jgi:hypothetical protein